MTGVGNDAGAPDAPKQPHDDEARAFDQPLLHSRWRHFGWAAFWLALGVLFMAAFSVTGIVLGLVFLALGLPPLAEFVRTLAHPAGAIRADGTVVHLPPRVCAGTSVNVPLAEVKRAFFLRRALPFMAHGPILVIETGRGSFFYPRDWFESEADQEKVVDGINRQLQAKTRRSAG